MGGGACDRSTEAVGSAIVSGVRPYKVTKVYDIRFREQSVDHNDMQYAYPFWRAKISNANNPVICKINIVVVDASVKDVSKLISGFDLNMCKAGFAIKPIASLKDLDDQISKDSRSTPLTSDTKRLKRVLR